jgi:hypothetical protein
VTRAEARHRPLLVCTVSFERGRHYADRSNSSCDSAFMDASDPTVDVEALRSDLLLRANSEDCSSTQRQVVTWMRWMLAGPYWRSCGGGQSARTAAISTRIWASSCAVFGFAIGHLARTQQNFDFRDHRIPASWNVLGYVLQGLAFVTGVVMMEVTVTMAQKLSHSGAIRATETAHIEHQPEHQTNSLFSPNEDTSSRDFLGIILTSSISDEAQRSVKQVVFIQMAQISLMFMCYVWIAAAFLTPISQSDSDVDFDVGIAKLLAVTCAPMTIIVLAGWGMFVNVPRIIVSDHVKRAAECVRVIKFRPNKADHVDEANVMFAAVVNSHERMVRLSSLLAPAVTIGFYMPVSFALYFLAMATVPRGEPADWIDDKYPRSWFIIEAMSMWLIIVLPFAALSTSTDACDQLLSALTVNINVRCRSEYRRTGSSLASPRDLIRISGIRDYFKGLNRDQGMGFTWRGVRVSTQLVRKVSLFGVVVLFVWLWFCVTSAGLLWNPVPA